MILDGLTGFQLVLEAINPSAPVTWRLACKLLFLQPLSDFPSGAISGELYGRKVWLNQKSLVDAPLSSPSPYSIKLLIPWWHQQLNIKIWQREQTW